MNQNNKMRTQKTSRQTRWGPGAFSNTLSMELPPVSRPPHESCTTAQHDAWSIESRRIKRRVRSSIRPTNGTGVRQLLFVVKSKSSDNIAATWLFSPHHQHCILDVSCRGANGMIYNIHALEANGRHRSARYGFRGTVKGRASSQHEYRKQPRRCGKCESLLIDLRARVMTRGRSNDCRSYFSVCKPAQFGSTAWTALPMLTDHSLHAALMSI